MVAYCFASVKQYGRLREDVFYIDNLFPSSMCFVLNCLLRQKYHHTYIFYCVLWVICLLFSNFGTFSGLVKLDFDRFLVCHVLFPSVIVKPLGNSPYSLINTCVHLVFNMFSTLSRVEKTVWLCFTNGVQEPRCEVIKLFSFCLPVG